MYRSFKLLLSITVILILFFNQQLIAQQMPATNYDSLWKKLDEQFIKKGLTASAISEADKIYARAKKEHNEPQQIKVLVFRINLEGARDENKTAENITRLETELKTASGPAQAILHSLLAQLIEEHFNENRYKLYERGATLSFKKEDIDTWSIDDYHRVISQHFLASLQPAAALQQVKLSSYEPLIIKGNVRNLRPTLFDLLANRALDYFRNDERDVNKPAYAFEMDQASAFDPAADFVTRKFKTSDTSSVHYKALLLYQQLIRFHLNEPAADALLDIDLSRIAFVHQYSVHEDKDSLYLASVNHIANQYAQTPAAAQAWYLVAQWHADLAAKYDPVKDSSNRFEYLKAKQICEQVAQQKTESEGKSNALKLLQQIQLVQLQLFTEKVNEPELPFRTLVEYRNLTSLQLRIIPITSRQRLSLPQEYANEYWSSLLALKSSKTWSQSLPATNDYQQHRVEIKVDALPIGEYILLSSSSANFNAPDAALAVQFFHVSNISYVNNDDDYFVLNRETGQPLEKATVQSWYSSYDYNVRKYTRTKGAVTTSDNHGYFKLPEQKESRGQTRLEITHGKDYLFLDDEHYQTYRNQHAIPELIDQPQTFFFMDRGIYRPGQTIFFKGIVVSRNYFKSKSTIMTGKKTMVVLQDANGEAIDSVAVATNEFGSYSGRFVLPMNTLNGEFALQDEKLNGQQEFSVEEYKRPKFEVSFEKVKGSFRLNDSIMMTGTAKAYAGNSIDGAKVLWHVQRVARILYPWFRGKIGVSASPMEIGSGVATTDKDGKFNISFKAIPDKSLPVESDPVFDYQVTADVTDINGETRSSSETLSVTYKALLLALSGSNGLTLPADSLKTLYVRTENSAAEFVPAKVRVSVYRLGEPERLIRERFWEQPDQFVMSSPEYVSLFPHDDYRDELNKEHWARKEKAIEVVDSSQASGLFNLPAKKLAAGWYVIEAETTDKFGQPVKTHVFAQLFDEKAKGAPATAYSFYQPDNRNVEPGEKAQIRLGSAADHLFVIQDVEHTLRPDSAHNQYSYLTLNNQQTTLEFPVTETDRGSFGVTHFFVKHNRFFSLHSEVNVQWTNKRLDISFETFRDKILPGAQETWKVKITGYRKEKVAAEMLASMYDASLDQFKPHYWINPDINPWHMPTSAWMGSLNFMAVPSQFRYLPQKQIAVVDKRYDGMIGIGGRRIGGQYRLQGRALGIASDEPTESMMAPSAAPKLEKSRVVQDVTLEETETNLDENPPPPPPGYLPVQGPPAPAVTTRKNFNETAFFLPDLRTDSAGNISFSFTMPEALTQWKFNALAHTKDLSFGSTQRTIITQKDLMLQPNAPRFIREGDKLELSAKVVNMTGKEMTGTVSLELLNANTMQPADGWFQNLYPNQYFTAEAGQSTVVNFPIQVPYQFNMPVIYRLKAVSGNYTDGEEAALPLLSNRMLLTETLPLNMRGNGSKNFKLEKLLQSGNSETMQNHALTLEFTSNPAWYAVQALPYLTDYPYDCAEQNFNRYYANSLAGMIAAKAPKLQAIISKWNTTDTAALTSNLQKNPELKSILLEETPWVLQAKTEAQQKKNISILFDLVRMNRERSSSFQRTLQLQTPNGGFMWFAGGPDDRFMTQYIMTGIGHLQQLGALTPADKEAWQPVIAKALAYLDQRILEDYTVLSKSKTPMPKIQPDAFAIQYLYMRSFFNNIGISGKSLAAVSYYRKQAATYWLQQGRFLQGMTALALYRTGDKQTATNILKSLKENAINSEEMGMYWKENRGGYYWYQAPTETQSLMIEVFSEIAKDTKTVDDLKTWLLKQKQVQNWGTTKATADACYALLLQGSDWLSEAPIVNITIGDKKISSLTEKIEAGTGYFKKTFDGPFVNSSMGNISVDVSTPDHKSSATVWGSVYWQYFEQLDKITPGASPLSLKKQLFVTRSSGRGPAIEPLSFGAALKVGDKVSVRIELRVDRDMEYVHMKDMRASGMEPVNVLSEYKWQGGLGYYESTKDASTNFFFNWLPKGTYVFEYPLFASQAGEFSNGVTNIECMYAPEFAAHSEGTRVSIELQ